MKLETSILQTICDQIAAEINVVVAIFGSRGMIVASSMPSRVGAMHEGAARIMAGDMDSFTVTAEDAARSSTMLEGCTSAIDFEGRRLFSVAVAAPLEVPASASASFGIGSSRTSARPSCGPSTTPRCRPASRGSAMWPRPPATGSGRWTGTFASSSCPSASFRSSPFRARPFQAADVAAHQNRVDGVVEAVEYLGWLTKIAVRHASGTAIMLEVPGKSPVAVGTPVTLGWRAEHTWSIADPGS